MIVMIAGMFIQFMTELAVILEAFDSFHATIVQAVALTHCYGPSGHLEYGGNRLNNSQNLLIVALVYGQSVHPERAVAYERRQIFLNEVCLCL